MTAPIGNLLYYTEHLEKMIKDNEVEGSLEGMLKMRWKELRSIYFPVFKDIQDNMYTWHVNSRIQFFEDGFFNILRHVHDLNMENISPGRMNEILESIEAHEINDMDMENIPDERMDEMLENFLERENNKENKEIMNQVNLVWIDSVCAKFPCVMGKDLNVQRVVSWKKKDWLDVKYNIQAFNYIVKTHLGFLEFKGFDACNHDLETGGRNLQEQDPEVLEDAVNDFIQKQADNVFNKFKRSLLEKKKQLDLTISKYNERLQNIANEPGKKAQKLFLQTFFLEACRSIIMGSLLDNERGGNFNSQSDHLNEYDILDKREGDSNPNTYLAMVSKASLGWIETLTGHEFVKLLDEMMASFDDNVKQKIKDESLIHDACWNMMYQRVMKRYCFLEAVQPINNVMKIFRKLYLFSTSHSFMRDSTGNAIVQSWDVFVDSMNVMDALRESIAQDGVMGRGILQAYARTAEILFPPKKRSHYWMPGKKVNIMDSLESVGPLIEKQKMADIKRKKEFKKMQYFETWDADILLQECYPGLNQFYLKNLQIKFFKTNKRFRQSYPENEDSAMAVDDSQFLEDKKFQKFLEVLDNIQLNIDEMAEDESIGFKETIDFFEKSFQEAYEEEIQSQNYNIFNGCETLTDAKLKYIFSFGQEMMMCLENHTNVKNEDLDMKKTGGDESRNQDVPLMEEEFVDDDEQLLEGMGNDAVADENDNKEINRAMQLESDNIKSIEKRKFLLVQEKLVKYLEALDVYNREMDVYDTLNSSLLRFKNRTDEFATLSVDNSTKYVTLAENRDDQFSHFLALYVAEMEKRIKNSLSVFDYKPDAEVEPLHYMLQPEDITTLKLAKDLLDRYNYIPEETLENINDQRIIDFLRQRIEDIEPTDSEKNVFHQQYSATLLENTSFLKLACFCKRPISENDVLVQDKRSHKRRIERESDSSDDEKDKRHDENKISKESDSSDNQKDKRRDKRRTLTESDSDDDEKDKKSDKHRIVYVSDSSDDDKSSAKGAQDEAMQEVDDVNDNDKSSAKSSKGEAMKEVDDVNDDDKSSAKSSQGGSTGRMDSGDEDYENQSDNSSSPSSNDSEEGRASLASPEKMFIKNKAHEYAHQLMQLILLREEINLLETKAKSMEGDGWTGVRGVLDDSVSVGDLNSIEHLIRQKSVELNQLNRQWGDIAVFLTSVDEGLKACLKSLERELSTPMAMLGSVLSGLPSETLDPRMLNLNKRFQKQPMETTTSLQIALFTEFSQCLQDIKRQKEELGKILLMNESSTESGSSSDSSES